jgi:hypothetical protein
VRHISLPFRRPTQNPIEDFLYLVLVHENQYSINADSNS